MLQLRYPGRKSEVERLFGFKNLSIASGTTDDVAA